MYRSYKYDRSGDSLLNITDIKHWPLSEVDSARDPSDVNRYRVRNSYKIIITFLPDIEVQHL